MINFYYDRIYKNWPLPNGVLNKKWDHKRKYYGFQLQSGIPIEAFNNFYYIAQKNNIAPILFTGDQITENLYYPIEIRANGDVPIVNSIPKKTKKRLQKNLMKLVIFCFGATGFEQYELIKFQVDKFKENGIRDITVVTDELKGVFSKYLDVKTISFDYYQILAQTILRSKKNHWRSKLPIYNYLKFDIKNFNPAYTYYNYDKDHIMHKISLIAELDFRKLPLRFNNIIGPRYDSTDVILYDKWRTDSENNLLKPYLDKYICNNIEAVESWKDYTDSFITLHHQVNVGTGNVLVEELHSLHTDLKTWFNVASGKPFIIFGSYNILAYLNNEGYFTFPNIINESYDRCSNVPQRAFMIANEIERVDKDLKNSVQTYKDLAKLYESNRIKFLSKDHLPKFINLYDSIQYR